MNIGRLVRLHAATSGAGAVLGGGLAHGERSEMVTAGALLGALTPSAVFVAARLPSDIHWFCVWWL